MFMFLCIPFFIYLGLHEKTFDQRHFTKSSSPSCIIIQRMFIQQKQSLLMIDVCWHVTMSTIYYAITVSLGTLCRKSILFLCSESFNDLR